MPLILVALFSCEKEDPVVTSIALDKSELELKVGEIYDFKVTHNPPEAKTPTYDWSVSSGDIARIDQSGHFEAINVGDTYVTVVTTDIVDPVTGERFTQKCKVTVKPIEAEGIKLDKSELTLDPSKKETLTCTITPENTTNKNVYWKSSDDKVVAVQSKEGNSNQAELTATGAGEAIITVYLTNNSKMAATCKVKVNPAKVEGISFSEKEKTVMQGESFNLSLVFTPSYATNKNATYSSSDENIATVDNNGNVKTVHVGECVIKAKSEDGGFEAECKVIVKPIPLESISFEESGYAIEDGGTLQLELKYYPENASNKDVTWSSSNTNVATVDKNGVVKGINKGNATITATSTDGGHTASCSVKIADISNFMYVYFSSSSIVNINGFITGNISCVIRNNSSNSVKLTRFYVVDSNTNMIVAQTTEESLLGSIFKPGESVGLSGRFNSVFAPIFVWEMEYKGQKYETYKRFGTDLKSSKSIEPKGKSSNMIQLYKE